MRRTLTLTVSLALSLALPSGCTDEPDPAGPEPPPSALRFVAIDAGYYHSCGLSRSDAAWCWGWNPFGALGDGTRETRLRPVRVAGGHSFEMLDVGGGHSCALTTAGAAWCWGAGDEGQLGYGSFQLRDEPVRVAGGHVFASISAGHAHSCALAADGVAWCWGDDSTGQLGDGERRETPRSALPVRVELDEPFVAIHAGYYQSCGLTADGAAWCWGRNHTGQNGDGTFDNRHTPVAVLGGHTFALLALGDRFVCGTSDGAALCWGANEHAQLGLPPSLPVLTPVAVDGADGLVSLVASSGASSVGGAQAYACGIRNDGGAVCWGGAIPGIRAQDPAPEPLDERIRFEMIATGPQSVCGLSRDGYAYCGGTNGYGQLGNGSAVSSDMLEGVEGPAGS